LGCCLDFSFVRLDFSCVRLDFSLNVKIGEPSLVQADISARGATACDPDVRPASVGQAFVRRSQLSPEQKSGAFQSVPKMIHKALIQGKLTHSGKAELIERESPLRPCGSAFERGSERLMGPFDSGALIWCRNLVS
jgi:hypothetical protein